MNTTYKMPLQSYMDAGRDAVNRLLDTWMPSEKCEPPLLHEAMRYSLFAGGKRFRSVLCLAAAESVGAKHGAVLPFAAALELVHTYSLVHDDLPAMDNDTYRRGQLTNHKKFGEGTAILVGDGLLAAAFSLISEKGLTGPFPHKKILLVTLELSAAIGSAGMVGGQSADIQAQGKVALPLEQVYFIHTRKTGCLIRAAVRIGGMLGGASPKKLSALTHYGEAVGLAFQIADDILDVEGNAARMGKAIGGDHSKEKWTYPRRMGLAASKKEAERLIESALSALLPLGPEADRLGEVARYILHRKD